MSDRSQMLYLLHAERRLLDQVYQRRYQSIGLSWEASLQWVQHDPDRISRLLQHKILWTEAENLRLSPIIQQFWEQWGEDLNPYSWAELQADWEAFCLQILESDQLASSAQLRYWVAQLQIWQQFLLSLNPQDLDARQEQWILTTAGQLESQASQRLGLDQALDRQIVLLLDRLQEINKLKKVSVNDSELFRQIAHLQSLRRKDILFVETDIEERISELEATLWNAPTPQALWPSLRT